MSTEHDPKPAKGDLRTAMAARKAERAAERAARTTTAARTRKRRQRSNVLVNREERVLRFWQQLQRSSAQTAAKNPRHIKLPLAVLLHRAGEPYREEYLATEHERAAAMVRSKIAHAEREIHEARVRGDELSAARLTKDAAKLADDLKYFEARARVHREWLAHYSARHICGHCERLDDTEEAEREIAEQIEREERRQR